MRRREAEIYCTCLTEAESRSTKKSLRQSLVCVLCVFLSVRLTGLQPVHVLQSDDVSFVEAEQSPVLSNVVPHRHHVL